MALSSFRTNFQMFNTTTQGVSVAPSLLLDFTKSENLDPRVSFTGSSIATRFNSRGLMETVTNSKPRYEYDPSTKKLTGLMIEDGRTNLLRHSNDFSNAVWLNVNGSLVRNQDVVGLDGTTSAWTLDDQSTLHDSAGTEQVVAITPSLSTSYCLSIWAKQGTASLFDFYMFFTGVSVKGSRIRHTWSTGVTQAFASDGGGIVPLDYGKIEYPDGWYRFYFVVRDSNNGSNSSIQFRLYPGGRDAGFTGSTLFQRAQLEIGEYPTSYIPTTTATVQRTTESASVSGSLFTPWYNPASGTLYLDAINNTRTIDAHYPHMMTLAGADPNIDIISIHTRTQVTDSSSGNAFASIVASNSVQLSAEKNPTDSNLRHKIKAALAYEKNNSMLATYGRSTSTFTSVSLPTVTSLLLFGQARYQMKPSGIIKVAAYYPKRLSAEELQVLTLL